MPLIADKKGAGMYSLGFIGCGNMGGALARSAQTMLGETVAVFDRTAEKTAALEQEYGFIPTTADDIAENAEFVVLGVKPQQLEEVMAALQPALEKNPAPVIVSMAAGVSIDAVKRFAGGDYPVIRIMPNTPCAVGAGVVLYATDGVSAMQEKIFRLRLAGAGAFVKMDEKDIDGAGALSGCGPAYFYLFANGLAQGAQDLGIDRETAVRLAAQTMIGAGKMLLENGDPIELKDRVCSPGGTTLAGVAALDKGNLQEVAASAVKAAYARTLELKK